MLRQLDALKMKTDFDGLIRLLANDLYSDPEMFIREIIQNAYDGILCRKACEPELIEEIHITVNISEQTIVFNDNGIGMD